MKNLNLELIAVQEMRTTEMHEHTGGIEPISIFLIGAAIVAGSAYAAVFTAAAVCKK